MSTTMRQMLEAGVHFGHQTRYWNPKIDRKSTRLNSSHSQISYAVFCLKKKTLHRPSLRTDAPGALFVGSPSGLHALHAPRGRVHEALLCTIATRAAAHRQRPAALSRDPGDPEVGNRLRPDR